jgi:hypothetical protein
MSRLIDIDEYRHSRGTKGNFSVMNIVNNQLENEFVGVYDNPEDMISIITKPYENVKMSDYVSKYKSETTGFSEAGVIKLHIFQSNGNSTAIWRIYLRDWSERNALADAILNTFNIVNGIPKVPNF